MLDPKWLAVATAENAAAYIQAAVAAASHATVFLAERRIRRADKAVISDAKFTVERLTSLSITPETVTHGLPLSAPDD